MTVVLNFEWGFTEIVKGNGLLNIGSALIGNSVTCVDSTENMLFRNYMHE